MVTAAEKETGQSIRYEISLNPELRHLIKATAALAGLTTQSWLRSRIARDAHQEFDELSRKISHRKSLYLTQDK